MQRSHRYVGAASVFKDAQGGRINVRDTTAQAVADELVERMARRSPSGRSLLSPCLLAISDDGFVFMMPASSDRAERVALQARHWRVGFYECGDSESSISIDVQTRINQLIWRQVA